MHRPLCLIFKPKWFKPTTLSCDGIMRILNEATWMVNISAENVLILLCFYFVQYACVLVKCDLILRYEARVNALRASSFRKYTFVNWIFLGFRICVKLPTVNQRMMVNWVTLKSSKSSRSGLVFFTSFNMEINPQWWNFQNWCYLPFTPSITVASSPSPASLLAIHLYLP